MNKKYQYRVEVGPFEFVFTSGAEALGFARTATEKFDPDKYYSEVPIKITIESIPEEKPEEKPEEVQEGDDD